MKTEDVAQDTPDSGEGEPEVKAKGFNRKERRMIEQDWARRERQEHRRLYREMRRGERSITSGAGTP